MDNCCVFFDYGYYADGEIGWEFFERKAEALSFIEDAMKANSSAELDDFTLVKCSKLTLKAVKVVTKIKVEDG